MFEDRLMKVSYFTMDTGACTLYRTKLPIDMLAHQGKIEAMQIHKGDDNRRISQALEADVFVVPRIIAGKLVDSLHMLQEDGKKLVSDYDDNVFKVHWSSNHYAEYGTEDVNLEFPDGKKMVVWKDKFRGFDIDTNKERLELIKKSMSWLDLLTTTGPELAERFKPYAKKIVDLPNCLNLHRWKKADLKRGDELKILMTGGSSHYHDWVMLVDVLPEILKKYKNAKLYVFGQMFSGVFKKCPKEQLVHVPWEDTCCYPYRMSLLGADICLIPLEDDEFNRCKSPIKFVEQGALEVPCIVSYVTPYKEVYDGNNMVMIKNNSEESWFKGISMLADDPLLRAHIAGAARRTIERDYDIEKKCDLWLEAYKGLFNGNHSESSN